MITFFFIMLFCFFNYALMGLGPTAYIITFGAYCLLFLIIWKLKL